MYLIQRKYYESMVIRKLWQEKFSDQAIDILKDRYIVDPISLWFATIYYESFQIQKN